MPKPLVFQGKRARTFATSHGPITVQPGGMLAAHIVGELGEDERKLFAEAIAPQSAAKPAGSKPADKQDAAKK